MLDLALYGGDAPRIVSDICKSQNLTIKYAGRLLLKLREAGIVSSVRGVQGGYVLKRKPEHITLLEIIEIMEGNISIVDCVLCPKNCKSSKNCSVREMWSEINAGIRSLLAKTTLRDIMTRQNGIADYCI